MPGRTTSRVVSAAIAGVMTGAVQTACGSESVFREAAKREQDSP
ncbi:hypothetical protein [Streptomyces sp. NPDC046870]